MFNPDEYVIEIEVIDIHFGSCVTWGYKSKDLEKFNGLENFINMTLATDQEEFISALLDIVNEFKVQGYEIVCDYEIDNYELD